MKNDVSAAASEEEWEDVLIYVNFPYFEDNNLLREETKIVLGDFTSSTPYCRIENNSNQLVFEGQYELNLGTQLFFTSPTSISSSSSNVVESNTNEQMDDESEDMQQQQQQQVVVMDEAIEFVGSSATVLQYQLREILPPAAPAAAALADDDYLSSDSALDD